MREKRKENQKLPPSKASPEFASNLLNNDDIVSFGDFQLSYRQK